SSYWWSISESTWRTDCSTRASADGRSSDMTLELSQPTESAQVRVRNPRPKFTLIAAVVTLAVIVMAAIFAPLVAPFDPASQDLLHTLEGPSRAHWLGTDDVGRDILSRI